MTTQIGDIYKYNKVQYTCLSVSNRGLFDPREYGLQPSEMITACWRGFWCEYEIANNELILQTLHVHDENDSYPEINGVRITPKESIPGIPAKRYVGEEFVPAEIPRFFGHETYENLALAIPYTGMILLASDYVEKERLDWTYGYRVLLSLEFDNGKLIDSKDQSELARMVREEDKRLDKHEPYWDDDYINGLPDIIRNPLWWCPTSKEREARFKKLEQELEEFMKELEANKEK